MAVSRRGPAAENQHAYAWLGFSVASLATTVIESHGGLIRVALLLFSGIAGYLWFEFYRVWNLPSE
jgi:hypothetical protein